jgi:serine/threonine-protein kinase PpkA
MGVERTPALVPGYSVLHMIGRGGQARVYLAERDSDGLRVALKVLDRRLRQEGLFLARLMREYKLIAAIENEHVARIYDQGFTGESPYLAMEFLPAGTLAGRMHEGLSSRHALRITSQIARALDAIHAKGIVHRDLKPANILFRADGRPVIVDFGLAKDLAATSTLTLAGQMIATPRYMSPEQCLGAPVDARSDLYSLGAMFYEMLTGEKIFQSADAAVVVSMHIQAPVPRLPQRLAGYQPILDRLLAKNPDERFQSARELFARIAI